MGAAKGIQNANHVVANVEEDGVDLDENGDVMHKVDQSADATEREKQAGPGRNPRYECTLTRRGIDGKKSEECEDESGGEDANGNLSAAVAHVTP